MKTALVAGASGLAGRAMVDRLLEDGGYHVLALARRANDLFADTPGVIPLACNLLEPDSVAAALKPHTVNLLFYAALYTGKGGLASYKPKTHFEVRAWRASMQAAGPAGRLFAKVMPNPFYDAFNRASGGGEPEKNLAMFRNVLDPCRGPELEHVTVVTGGKYHGHHLGPRFYPPYKSPIEEHHPRPPGHNWYYAVEDYAAQAQGQDETWHYSTVRPSSIMGFASGSFYNLGTSLAVYASIQKYLGEPLLMPAAPAVQNVAIEFSPAALIADLMLWTAREPRCDNEAYCAAFGARTCWREVWKDIAAYFEMEPVFATRAMSTTKVTQGYDKVWTEMCDRFDLVCPAFDDVCSPAFMDQQFLIDWDAAYSPDKSRAHGYSKSTDAKTMFQGLFDGLAGHRVIPAPAAIGESQRA